MYMYACISLLTTVSFFSLSLSPSLASSGRRLESKPSPSQRAPRRPHPQARWPEARIVILEQPPVIDETDTQQGEVQVHVQVTLCIVINFSSHNMDASSFAAIAHYACISVSISTIINSDILMQRCKDKSIILSSYLSVVHQTHAVSLPPSPLQQVAPSVVSF